MIIDIVSASVGKISGPRQFNNEVHDIVFQHIIMYYSSSFYYKSRRCALLLFFFSREK